MKSSRRRDYLKPMVTLLLGLVLVIGLSGNGYAFRSYGCECSSCHGFADECAPPPNTPPVARAGTDQTLNAGAAVTLDGSASYDPEGSAITYSWSQTGGSNVSLSGRTTASPSFTAPQPSSNSVTLTFSLTVTDDVGNTDIDYVDITVNHVNAPPVANAGTTQTVAPNNQVTLDGSNSSDPDDGISTYAWTQTGGPTVILSNSGAVQPTFIAPDVGAGSTSLGFRLTVTDSFGLSSSDNCIVNVTAGNQPPTADAGIEQNVDEGDLVTLDGTGSNDSDGSIASYQWAQTGGTTVTLSNPASATPTFTAPAIGTGGGSLTFQLTVTDDRGLQGTDNTIVNVAWVNMQPIANAGDDQTGAYSVEEGKTVVLDGSASSDPDDGIASYLWEQSGSGPVVTLSDPSAVQPTFVTPLIDSGETTLTFRLTVTDIGGLQSNDEVLVTFCDNGITSFPDGVIPTMSAEGTPVGVSEPVGGQLTKLEAMSPTILPANVPIPEDMIHGLFDLEIKTDTPGAKVTVTIHLASPAPEGYKWYKFNPTTQVWTDYGTVTDQDGDVGAVFNAARDQVTLTLVDGGMGDDDDQSNGVIKDPSGLGAATNFTAPSSGSGIASNSFGSGAGGCFMSTAETGSILKMVPSWLTLLVEVFFLSSPAVYRRVNKK
jgi:hypothetical protein